VRRALKTDLFEEAFGDDALLPDLLGTSETWLAMDLAEATVRKARRRERRPAAKFLAADARRLPLQTASIDLVLSTSTLDHFDSRREFVAALAEIARVLRPGGRLVLTIDNPSNPLYWPLRGWAERGGFPSHSAIRHPNPVFGSCSGQPGSRSSRAKR
jgi:ubiquinone/menaquinone biosynthesis C-methylase UbiE